MKITYTPECCSGDDAAYAGTVTLRAPTYDERMAIYDEVGVDMDGVKTKPIAYIRAVAKQVPQFLVEFSIRRKSDDYEFKSFDELQYDSEMAGAITEMATKLVGKFQVGNGSKSS